jgi:AraC-like DNA-binding protein
MLAGCRLPVLAAIKIEITLNLTAVERVLDRTPLVALGEFRCPVTHPQFYGGGPQLCHYMVFPRKPVRIHLRGGETEIASPGTLRFYNIGDIYERSAVGGLADESDWIAIGSELIEQLLAQLSGAPLSTCRVDSRRRASKLFPATQAPATARLYLTQRRLFAAVRERTLSRLQLEEQVIECATEALGQAGAFWSRRMRCRHSPRAASLRRRRQLVEAAKQLLALDLALDLSLHDLAVRLHCSGAHLARVFTTHTGRSLHVFRQQLRLHRALELLEGGGWPLAQIAAEVGFASHSHMTQAFRRELGTVPSRLTLR